MNRTEAMELAQKKANDWDAEYRVLRRLDVGIEHVYEVEKSGSYDSPKGFRLVEVFRPARWRITADAKRRSWSW